jgi:hypothetical protein
VRFGKRRQTHTCKQHWWPYASALIVHNTITGAAVVVAFLFAFLLICLFLVVLLTSHFCTVVLSQVARLPWVAVTHPAKAALANN